MVMAEPVEPDSSTVWSLVALVAMADRHQGTMPLAHMTGEGTTHSLWLVQDGERRYLLATVTPYLGDMAAMAQYEVELRQMPRWSLTAPQSLDDWRDQEIIEGALLWVAHNVIAEWRANMPDGNGTVRKMERET